MHPDLAWLSLPSFTQICHSSVSSPHRKAPITYAHAHEHMHTHSNIPQQLSSLPQLLHNEESIPHPLLQPHFLGLLCPPPSVTLLLHFHTQQALAHTLSHPQPNLLSSQRPLSHTSQLPFPSQAPRSQLLAFSALRMPCCGTCSRRFLGHQAARCLVSDSAAIPFHYRADEN